ncbi:hypothetical protein B0H10DRAFT_2213819 [Mycena sp. CBHHK59/15]|nr:hypothetical protein B0H10DRAFT_2213819 [Mycena sp. CBHHK59/15]
MDSDKTSTAAANTAPSPHASAPAAAPKSFNLGAHRASSPIVLLEHVQQGLQAFDEERARYNAAATLQLCTHGGISSSTAFAQEHMVEDARFAARSPGTMSSSQNRRDARNTDTSLMAPASFSVSPSSASQPVLRAPTAITIGSKDGLAPGKDREIIMDLEGGVTPITTPDAFKVLKLLLVPPKDGKGKAESSAALTVWNNSNNGILTSYLVVMQSKHVAFVLEVANATCRLKGKMAHIAADLVSLHREMDVIRHSPALHDQVNDGAAHDIVAVSREISLLANEVKDEFGLVYDDLRDLQDCQRCCATHDEDFNTLDACMVTLTAANDKLHTTNIDLESKVLVLEGKAAAADVKHCQLELDLLGIRKAITELQTEAAQRTLAFMQKPALAVNAAPASGTGGRSFDLRKGRKHTAPADANAPGSKRTKGIPAEVGDRSDYGHWIRMCPIMLGMSGTPASIFKRMIAVVFESSYAANHLR